MITVSDYYMGRYYNYVGEFSSEIEKNSQITVDRANLLLTKFKMAGDTEYRKVHDGWRPASLNAITTTANPVSQHMFGKAIDITDPNNTLYQWIGDCVLEECKLWLEALRGPWVHVQIVPPNGWKKGMSRTFRI
jgi:hypothetical protein